MEIPTQLKDFRNFLYLVWKELNLPDPTLIQYEIADYMQHGPKRAVIQGFRGVGKSWICSAFVVHQLLLDPSKIYWLSLLQKLEPMISQLSHLELSTKSPCSSTSPLVISSDALKSLSMSAQRLLLTHLPSNHSELLHN